MKRILFALILTIVACTAQAQSKGNLFQRVGDGNGVVSSSLINTNKLFVGSGQDNEIRMVNTGSWPAVMSQSAGSIFSILDGGSHYFAIDSSGNVGIDQSVNNPVLTAKLTVPGTVSATAFVGDGSGLTGISAGSGTKAYVSETVKTASGAYSFTVPTGITVSDTIEMILQGAGGGSGGVSSGSFSTSGAGGSGDTCRYWLKGLTAGDTITGSVGAGGAAGSSSTAGGDGGNTTAKVKGSTTINAYGGKGSNFHTASSADTSPGGSITTDCDSSPSPTTIVAGRSQRGMGGGPGIAPVAAARLGGAPAGTGLGGCAAFGDSGGAGAPGCGAGGMVGTNTSGNAAFDGVAIFRYVVNY